VRNGGAVLDGCLQEHALHQALLREREPGAAMQALRIGYGFHPDRLYRNKEEKSGAHLAQLHSHRSETRYTYAVYQYCCMFTQTWESHDVLQCSSETFETLQVAYLTFVSEGCWQVASLLDVNCSICGNGRYNLDKLRSNGHS
jgi:hypothetical protein